MKRVIAELAALNKKVDTIVTILQKPENKFLKIMGIIGNAAGVVGILSIIDLVKHWILGG